jgi:hypothetical protein
MVRLYPFEIFSTIDEQASTVSTSFASGNTDKIHSQTSSCVYFRTSTRSFPLMAVGW